MAVDKYLKKEAKAEIEHVLSEIDLRFKRLESFKGAGTARTDKL